MKKKQIFIAIQYMEIGGAERSLLGLLNSIDYSNYEVDLFIYRHTGEFMSLIPNDVNILPEIEDYSLLAKPIKQCLQKGKWRLALARLWAKHKANQYHKKANTDLENYTTVDYLGFHTTKHLPIIPTEKKYEMAISFLTPHHIVKEKVNALKKIAWIHTDYSTISINAKSELLTWQSYDHIASISPDVTASFLSKFPSLEDKIVEIENILSPQFIHEQAKEYVPEEFDTQNTNLCSIGRFCTAKAFDRAVWICKNLVVNNPKIKWYIIGYGNGYNLIQQQIKEAAMQDHFIILGKKANPYPYIKACDFYIQPSRYEGKAVTVREAQILEKLTVITDYPTSSSQLTHQLDGIIIPQDITEAANEIAKFLKNKELQNTILTNLATSNYGNESEIQKIYNLIN